MILSSSLFFLLMDKRVIVDDEYLNSDTVQLRSKC